MPNLSNNAVYNSGTNDQAAARTPTSSSRPNHSFAMDRFLNDKDQKCPLELRPAQSAAEAEAAAKARMSAKLQAFAQHF